MANPNLEDGHFQIANEYFEALCRIRIPGEARQVLDFIIRKTWGWKKKEDKIPLSQISLGTGLKKSKVIRARQKLLQLNLINIPQKGNGDCQSYSINKDFDSWKPFPKRGTYPKKGTIIPLKGNKTYPKKGHSKETTKETIQKKLFLSDSDEFRLAKLLLDLIRERYPEFKEPDLQRWAKVVDLMIRRDEGRSPQKIEATIRAAQTDPFWQNNILSTGKLREKYDQLRLKFFAGDGSAERESLKLLKETVGGAL